MRAFVTALLVCCAALAPAHAADRAKLQDFVAQYTLDDGRTLAVTERRHYLVAQIDGQAPVTLVEAGPARFVDPGSRLVLTFDQRPNGNVRAVTLSTVSENRASMHTSGIMQSFPHNDPSSSNPRVSSQR